MAYHPQTLKEIAQLGGNIDLSEINYSPETVKELLLIAKESGAHVTVSSSYSSIIVQEFVELAGNQLTVKVN
ncbi:MAG: hypothetical protein F6K00_22525 [Leptolyngbya sp. SIOISBB]|nr:hypothetical protein [Leptolyngbya sp. SIOISBB]